MSYTVTVFLAAVALDFLYVRWFRAVGDQHVLKAMAASMLLGACGLVGLTGVVADRWLAWPYLVGLGVGTLLGMKTAPKERKTETVPVVFHTNQRKWDELASWESMRRP